MACLNCPQGNEVVAVASDSLSEAHSRVDAGVAYHPLKVGEPLSTACERSSNLGSIPEIFHYPQFTVVGGEAVVGIPSNGGMSQARLSMFMTHKQGCYKNQFTRLASSCC